MGAYGSPELSKNSGNSNNPEQKKKFPLWGVFFIILALLFILFISTGLDLSSALATCGLFGIILYLVALVIAALKRKNKKPYAVGATVSTLILIFGVLIFSINSGSKPKTVLTGNKQQSSATSASSIIKDDAVEIDYKVLHKDYMDNPIKADSRYKNKKLIVSGKVSDIDREIDQRPYITFEISPLETIRMDFDKKNEPEVAKLKKGQTVKVVGECTGTLISTTVVLEDCNILE
ncbi:OB-fold protein [Caproiciproducens galactitolivorans]|uniref:tRNA_anti-like protein n=1 Tax=Caproiciproducens galactitolivorans TaxID=642589 RepID=A0ABT4BWR6_9FIRM|nr:hypothetical protein [Caproiciproducens galactitolivorans]MCY1715230.1 hypothetical protein [Caproiciproducens galactitolivorans]